jgi:expansin
MKKITMYCGIALVSLLFSCNRSEVEETVAAPLDANELNSSSKLSNLYKTTFTGEGTFYTPTALGNCSEEYPVNQLYAAMNKPQYNNSNACGSYIEVTRRGTAKKVIVKVLDQCPECPNGNVDLSKTAFLKLGTAVEGRIPISWKFIADPTNTKIAVRIKEGSSRYYIAMQIRNHKYMVSKLEVKNKSGIYEVLPRQSYNYFLDNNGIFNGQGPDGPYNLRITDVNANVVTTAVPLNVGVIAQTIVQFPITAQ